MLSVFTGGEALAVKVFAFLQSVLYLISSLLFYPVVFLLVVLFFYVVYKLGVFVGEYALRRKGVYPFLSRYLEELDALISQEADEVEIENLLQSWQQRMYLDLDKLRALVRVGPSLGLMGTLIPMGTGLAALAKGQMEKLISSMIIAFTTTVVGLAIAVIAYLLGAVKERWLEEEARLMEYYTEKRVKR